jgi:hypothetical protein
VDAVAPGVSSVVFTSAVGAVANTLGTGDTLDITVTMSESTTVTGTPQLALVVGSGGGVASYVSGSGTTSLVFRYTAVLGDTDTDGISMLADQLSLNSGTMADAAGNAVTLSHSAVAADSNYMVAAIKTFDAQITTSSTQGITGLDVQLWGVDGAVETKLATLAAVNGEVSIDSLVTFDMVKLSEDAVYSSKAINVFDVLATVDHIVGTNNALTGQSFQAADVTNDNAVNLFDVLALVDHIVSADKKIDTYDLVDSSGNRVTQVNNLSTGTAPKYQLVMNGDVVVSEDDFFTANYVGTLDIT